MNKKGHQEKNEIKQEDRHKRDTHTHTHMDMR